MARDPDAAQQAGFPKDANWLKKVHRWLRRAWALSSGGRFPLAFGLLALALAIPLSNNLMLDDAAIGFRYARRLAAGLGFTYNDHERVLGASNPLYVLILAAFQLLGWPAESAAHALGLFCLASCVGAVVYLAQRAGGRVGAVAAGLFLALDSFFRYEALSGMESALGCLLGLAVLIAMLNARFTLAGVLLGFALWNKLDAGLLALAVAAAFLMRRRFPWRIALFAGIVVAPWLLFATFYFGSPIPNSLVSKLHEGQVLGYRHNPLLWIVGFLGETPRNVLTMLSLSCLGWLLFGQILPPTRMALWTVFFWFGFHALACGVLNLGAGYPWYLTVLPPALALLGSYGVARLWDLKRSRAMSLAALLLMGWVAGRELPASYHPLRGGNPVNEGEAFDLDRRMAGIFVSEGAAPGETVGTCFGWVGYEAGLTVNDPCRINSAQMIEPSSYLVESGASLRENSRPPVVRGYRPVATFNLANDLYPGFTWFSVLARSESRLAQSSRRYLQYRLFELVRADTDAIRSDQSEALVVEGADLVARSPGEASFFVENEAQPMHLVFSTAREGGPAGDVAQLELLADGVPVYRQRLLFGPSQGVVHLPIDRPSLSGRTRLTFRVESVPRQRDWGLVRWRNAKVIVGAAAPRLERLHNPKLARLWQIHNWEP